MVSNMKFNDWLKKNDITKVIQLQRITGFNYFKCYNMMNKDAPTLIKKDIQHLNKITLGDLDANSFVELEN